MMNKTKIAKAIAMAMTGTALSAAGISTANAATTTMYNGYKFDSAASNTDGWVYGGIGYNYNLNSSLQYNGIVNPNYSGPTLYQITSVNPGPPASPVYGTTPLTVGAANFIGIGGSSTPSTSTPLGYVGSSHLNWAVDITGGGNQTANISVADAQSRYGFTAEVDTGAGAWQDVASTPDTGWKHQTDIGLIRTDTDSMITLNLTRMSAPSTPAGLTNDNFGITVFSGMDTNTGGYGHHGAWNCPTCGTPSLFTKSNPFGTTGLTYLAHDNTVDSTNGISFLAQAGQVYSIYLGGAGVGQWSQNVSDYKLSISASAVPVPAAVWLFGSALAGMGIIGRRKKAAA